MAHIATNICIGRKTTGTAKAALSFAAKALDRGFNNGLIIRHAFSCPWNVSKETPRICNGIATHVAWSNICGLVND